MRARAGLALVGAALLGVAATVAPVRGRGVVAADHLLASEAGRDLLRAGGNAVDAAVAAALAAGVVQPAGSGLGGGGFAIVAGAGSDRYVLDFREVAPAAATRDQFVGGASDAGRSRVGGDAVAVPGESRGLARLLAERGTRPPRAVAAPAIAYAARGFRVGDHLANALAGSSYGDVRSLFTVDGQVATAGVVVRNPALAATVRRWAATAGEDLHTGASARAVVDAARATGGRLTMDDLAGYTPVPREVLVARFGDHTLLTMPPPSSGGVVLAQALGVLEGYDLASLGAGSSDALHLVAEALKHGFADRAHHLGDPAFVDVDVARLTSEARIGEVRRKIWPGRTFPPEHYGPPISPPRDAGTQHISVVDAAGLGVALTTTINTSFGSGVVPASLGLPLNNEMDDFATAPGVPNAFGLVGAEANAIAPGKRPLSSMTPTVVLDRDGRVVMVIGASGGSTIISATLQVYLNVVVFGMDPQEAVSAPRIHHQWMPDTLFVEPDVPADVVRNLEARGHTVDLRRAFSSVQVVVVGPDGVASAASDPRKGGLPAAAREP